MHAVIVIVDGVLTDEYHAFHSVFARIEGLGIDTVGRTRGRFAGPGGAVHATLAYDEAWAADVVAVPGSLGCRRAADDPETRAALERLAASSKLVVASSTGSVLLAAAGVVHDAAVATHWLAGDLIGDYGCSASPDRLVATDKTITCSGVLSALDAALLVADRIEGEGTADRIRAELLAGGQHHLRSQPWWRRMIGDHRPARRQHGVVVGPVEPPPTPLSVMIELVDDPDVVARLRRKAARRPPR